MLKVLSFIVVKVTWSFEARIVSFLHGYKISGGPEILNLQKSGGPEIFIKKCANLEIFMFTSFFQTSLYVERSVLYMFKSYEAFKYHLNYHFSCWRT